MTIEGFFHFLVTQAPSGLAGIISISISTLLVLYFHKRMNQKD